jgi:hypothetical protein
MGMTGLPPGEFSLISPGTKIPGQVKGEDPMGHLTVRSGPWMNQEELSAFFRTVVT